MPRTEEANQRIREEQYTKILKAALTVFARKGMEATIAEVATAANVSYGLVYRYFDSKEALLVEIIENVLGGSLRLLEQALEMPGTPGERLHSLLTKILNGVREHPEFILLVQHMLGQEAEHNNPSEPRQPSVQQVLHNQSTHDHLRKLAQEQSRTYRSVLKQLIIEGQATGEIVQNDPDQLVTALTACVAGLSQGATRQTPEQFQQTFPDITIILRMLIPPKKENTNA